MNKFLAAFLSVFIAVSAFGNAAMPGMWAPGHGGRFIPLFKQDSVHFGKVQMQRELVLINLYPGFAAVKGEYWMYNTTDEPVTMRVGYPINGSYPAELVSNVLFGDLYKLKALVNDQPMNVVRVAEGYDSVYKMVEEMQVDNWYYFTCTFAPKQLTKITVYFLNNTSEAQLREGYSQEKGNAFAYILESGKAWAGKIERGQVLIKLNEDLSLRDFKGVYPTNILFGDNKHIQFAFTNLEPDSTNNILLWYRSDVEDFNFERITASAETYYKALDSFPIAEFDTVDAKKISKDDFEPNDSRMTWFWIILIGIVVLVLAAFAGLIYLIYRLIRKKR